MKLRFLISFFVLAVGLQAQEFVAFSNATSELGNISGFAYNDCVVDMNGDGLDDVVRVTNNNINIDFQLIDGGFELKTFPISLQNVPSWSIAAGDIDGNGLNDLLFGDGDAVSFVLANEDGSAYEEQAISDYIFSQRSTFADIDNDGHLDAFVCHDVDLSHPYRNDGNGNLTEDQSLIETVNLPGNYAAIWTDYDNDNDIDLYITKCRGGAAPGDPARTNGLYRNNGDGTFTEVAAEAGLDDNAQSWSTVFEDFDNDGDFDAFIVNHDFKNRFFLNNGDGTFTDIIGDTGIEPNDLGAWENASGDFNNDGFVDIFSELTKELYLNNGDLTFTGQDLMVDPGAIGDLNNDGFLDVIASGGLYLNNGNNNNWLKVNTKGIISNKNGIGARVEIYGDWGVQIREVRSGQSFAPMSSMQIHFGIGQATEVNTLVVKWPSGVVTTIQNPAINTTHDVPEEGCLLPTSELIVNGDTQLCQGETVELEIPDGFSDFVWSNGATTESITIGENGNFSAILFDDQGCTSYTNSVIVSVTEEFPPAIEIDGQAVLCTGDEVTLVASGGTDYTWSNGAAGENLVVDEAGEYTVSILGECSGDPLISEAVNISVLPAPSPITNTTLGVEAGTSTTLIADGQGGEVQWYDAPNGGNLLGVGDNFETPIVLTEYYVYPQSVHSYPGEEQSGGKPDFSGDGGLPSQGAYNLFDVWEPFTLNTVRVLVPPTANNGIRTVQLFDAAGTLLEQAQFDLTVGEHELELNFFIPAGQGYSLRCPEASLFRNFTPSAPLPYPYSIGDVGEITGSFVSNFFYYYFYDWKIAIGKIECTSERIEVFVEGLNSSNEALAQAGVEIFPNPSSTQLFVKIDNPASFLLLNDVTGKQVLRQSISGNELVTLDVSSLSSGIYTLQMEVNGKLLSSLIVVE